MEVATAQVRLMGGVVWVRRNKNDIWRPSPINGMCPIEQNSSDYVIVRKSADDRFTAEYYVAGDRNRWYRQLLMMPRCLKLPVSEGEMLAFNRQGVIARWILH
jgi:hypothetical protein